MKKIEAVILPPHLNAVRRELQRRGISGGFTVVDVRHSDSENRLLATENGVSGTFQERVKESSCLSTILRQKRL
jgi:nitrogen regulatory protein PII